MLLSEVVLGLRVVTPIQGAGVIFARNALWRPGPPKVTVILDEGRAASFTPSQLTLEPKEEGNE